MGTSRASRDFIYRTMGKVKYASKMVGDMALKMATLPARMKLGNKKTDEALMKIKKMK